jgi:hypothetical protein
MCENFVLSVQAPILSLPVRKYRLLLMLNFRVIALNFHIDRIVESLLSAIINLGFDGF